MSEKIPTEAPPSYAQATGKSGALNSSNQAGPSSSHLEVPGARNGIPALHRRSMEDESRALPSGWVRTFDPETLHQFFVDTKADPPRSIWTHPYDDPTYLASLSSEERERIEQESMNQPTKADIVAEHTDEEDFSDHASTSGKLGPSELPPRPEGKGKGKEKTFGRKLKDKLTGMTHEQREAERKRRAEEEEMLYQRHMAYRQAMSKAAQTGQPQLLGKDKDGKDVYVEPPQYQSPYGGYPGGAYSYNPYGSGVYSTPSARYVRPAGAYGRPYGRGYGGGYGMPLAIGGGVAASMMLGGLLF